MTANNKPNLAPGLFPNLNEEGRFTITYGKSKICYLPSYRHQMWTHKIFLEGIGLVLPRPPYPRL